MTLDPTTLLVGVLALGVGAQWLAWRMELPSIVLLILFGLALGPGLGLLDPDALIGAQLFPLVSIAVAAILFEGGLSLRLRELEETGRQLWRLLTVGILCTWLLATVLGHLVLGLDLGLALLLGAVLVVTGPTVALPLLQHVRPQRRIGALVKWEGIANDPVGALLAVLVLDWLLATGSQAHPLGSLVVALVSGTAIGLVGALAVGRALERHLVPDALHGPGVLVAALACFAGANAVHHESGLMAVTVMGIALANRRGLEIEHVLEFGENLRVVLIGGLFLLLGARVRLDDLTLLGPPALAFVALVVLVVRPLAVWTSLLGLAVPWREKLFLSVMAPRGIVAAAVTSLFAIQLTAAGFHQARLLVPVVFLVILTTVSFCGLAARPLALALGLANRSNDGVLVLGAHPLARAIAEALAAEGVRVVLVDANRANVALARERGLVAHQASIRSDWVRDELALDGVGHFVGLVPNDEVNALGALRLGPLLGRANCYRLAALGADGGGAAERGEHAAGRVLFGVEHGYADLERRFRAGARPRLARLTEDFGLEQFLARHGSGAVPLFAVTRQGGVRVFTAERAPVLEPGDRLLSLVGAAAPAAAA